MWQQVNPEETNEQAEDLAVVHTVCQVGEVQVHATGRELNRKQRGSYRMKTMVIMIGVCSHGNTPRECDLCKELSHMAPHYREAYPPPGIVAYQLIEIRTEDEAMFEDHAINMLQVDEFNLKEWGPILCLS